MVSISARVARGELSNENRELALHHHWNAPCGFDDMAAENV